MLFVPRREVAECRKRGWRAHAFFRRRYTALSCRNRHGVKSFLTPSFQKRRSICYRQLRGGFPSRKSSPEFSPVVLSRPKSGVGALYSNTSGGIPAVIGGALFSITHFTTGVSELAESGHSRCGGGRFTQSHTRAHANVVTRRGVKCWKTLH